jgi:hypothetical protein
MTKKFGLYTKLFIILFAFTTITSAKGQINMNQIYTISGKVSDKANKPVYNFWVILYQNTREIKRTLTGNDGRFYIGRLVSGPYKIVVKRQINGASLYDRNIPITTKSLYVEIGI